MQLMIILALTEGWYDHPVQRQQESDEASNQKSENREMEEAMNKSLAIIAGTVAILSGALFTSDSALAGGSVSAPSKYAHANRVASQQAQLRQAGRTDFPITEYSSSSARNRNR